MVVAGGLRVPTPSSSPHLGNPIRKPAHTLRSWCPRSLGLAEVSNHASPRLGLETSIRLTSHDSENPKPHLWLGSLPTTPEPLSWGPFAVDSEEGKSCHPPLVPVRFVPASTTSRVGDAPCPAGDGRCPNKIRTEQFCLMTSQHHLPRCQESPRPRKSSRAHAVAPGRSGTALRAGI